MQTNILPDVWEDEVGAETKSLRLTRGGNRQQKYYLLVLHCLGCR